MTTDDDGATDRPRSLFHQQSDPSWLEAYREHVRVRVSEIDMRVLGLKHLDVVAVEDVYTPLHARRGIARSTTSEARVALSEAVKLSRALLIIGDSGTGKTTFLNHLAQESLQSSAYLPLVIDLVDVGNVAQETMSVTGRLPWTTFVECLVTRAAEDGISIDVNSITRYVRDNPTLWLLDGLNEVVDPSLRRSVSDAIRINVRQWPKARFVMTATELVVRDGTAPATGEGGFDRITIDTFQDNEVKSFLDSFLRVTSPNMGSEQRRRRWEPFAREVLSNPDLRGQLTSPLYLTAAAIVYLSGPTLLEPIGAVSLPLGRVDLLESVTDWILAHRMSHLQKYGQTGREIQRLFNEVAFQLMTSPRGPRKKAGVGALSVRLAGVPSLHLSSEKAESFLRDASEVGGLLSRVGLGDVAMHETMRDFLASRALVQRSGEDGDWWDVVRPHLDDPSWYMLVRLLPGCLLRQGEDAVDEFFQRFGSDSQGADPKVKVRRLALGGSALRELQGAQYETPLDSAWRAFVGGCGELFETPADDVPIATRYDAALAFGLEGDVRLREPETIWVPFPISTCLVGAQSVDATQECFHPDAAPWEGPPRRVTVGPFEMCRFSLPVSLFRAFVEGGGYAAPAARFWPPDGWQWKGVLSVDSPLDWLDQVILPNTPVTGVSWYEAVAFARYMTENRRDGWIYRLPTEWEWEYAARGPNAQTAFPWGNSMTVGEGAEANWAGAYLRRKTPVGMFPASSTPEGIADLFGNVEEWTSSAWQESSDSHSGSGYPSSIRGLARTVKGGSCIRYSRLCRATYRSKIYETGRYHTVGFRLVRVQA
jgi:formylglycine-generating enzyme required for sulfatase activity/GTPase SAR1 family protein